MFNPAEYGCGRDGRSALDALFLVRFYFRLQRHLNVVCPFLSAVSVSHTLRVLTIYSGRCQGRTSVAYCHD
jgi:hypothetical protein